MGFAFDFSAIYIVQQNFPPVLSCTLSPSNMNCFFMHSIPWILMSGWLHIFSFFLPRMPTPPYESDKHPVFPQDSLWLSWNVISLVKAFQVPHDWVTCFLLYDPHSTILKTHFIVALIPWHCSEIFFETLNKSFISFYRTWWAESSSFFKDNWYYNFFQEKHLW